MIIKYQSINEQYLKVTNLKIVKYPDLTPFIHLLFTEASSEIA